MANFAVEALQIVPLPGHLGALPGHAHLHLPHLLHQRLLVFLQLPALAFQFLA